MSDLADIRGACDARFAGVREALARNVHEHGEIGAAVAIALDGRLVVDLCAGWADLAATRPWQPDTLVNVFSVGKAMATVALLILVERERIDLDAPVARYWPAFAAHDKDAITVRMVLSHRAGLPGVRTPLPAGSMYDWAAMTAALADETPWWAPGTQHGYHVNTFGFLVGELVRRASGISLGAFFRREVGLPLGADFHFGVGPADDARIADHLLPDDDTHLVEHLLSTETQDTGAPATVARRELLRCVYTNPSGLSGFGTVNTRAWRGAEIPSANGHATARGIARVYAALACGGQVAGTRLLADDTIAHATTEAVAGPDLVLGRPSRFGLGFQLSRTESPFGTSPRAFGHFGAGGAVGFADPDARLAFAYTTSLPGPRWRNPRNRGLIDAVYAVL